jgi:ribosomal protein S2
MKTPVSKQEMTFGQTLTAIVRKEAGVKAVVASFQTVTNNMVNTGDHAEIIAAFEDIQGRISDLKDIKVSERKAVQKKGLIQAQQERSKLQTMLNRVTKVETLPDGTEEVIKTPKEIVEDDEKGHVVADKEAKSEEDILVQMLQTAVKYADKHELNIADALERAFGKGE